MCMDQFNKKMNVRFVGKKQTRAVPFIQIHANVEFPLVGYKKSVHALKNLPLRKIKKRKTQLTAAHTHTRS